MKVGDIFPSKWYGQVEVIGKGETGYIIRFSDTGTEMEALPKNIEKGSVKDRFAPSVAGVGCLGNASTTDNPSLYSRWKRMVGACYDPLHVDFPTTGARGIKVAARWHCYENYEKDLLAGIQEIGCPNRYRVYRNGSLYSMESTILVQIG